jgi:predicted translin family RNA/ssDNA-binding protein
MENSSELKKIISNNQSLKEAILELKKELRRYSKLDL